MPFLKRIEQKASVSVGGRYAYNRVTSGFVCRKKLLYRRWDNYACEFEADDFPRSPETPQSKNNFQFARSRQCDATIKRELTLRMKVSAN